MAKYPEQTSKVLNPSGNVKMKDQMAHAAAPHTHFQEGGAPGTRSLADTTHGGMKNGGFVAAHVGDPGTPNVKATGGNPVSAFEVGGKEKLTREERAESPRERAREERDVKGEAKEAKKK